MVRVGALRRLPVRGRPKPCQTDPWLLGQRQIVEPTICGGRSRAQHVMHKGCGCKGGSKDVKGKAMILKVAQVILETRTDPGVCGRGTTPGACGWNTDPEATILCKDVSLNVACTSTSSDVW